MTAKNILFLIWAAGCLATAQWTWRRGIKAPAFPLVVGAVMIVIGQMLEIYNRGNPHGG